MPFENILGWPVDIARHTDPFGMSASLGFSRVGRKGVGIEPLQKLFSFVFEAF